jgi:hypothetical protein
MESINSIYNNHIKLLRMRHALQTIFHGLNVGITIGGSYALKWHSPEFALRTFHDYDFIVRGSEEAIQKARQILVAMLQLGLVKHPGDVQASDSGSWVMGELDGHPIDIILSVGKPCPCIIMESLEDIAKAKLCYKAKYRKQGKEPRPKDMQDLEILHKLLLGNPNIIWD